MIDIRKQTNSSGRGDYFTKMLRRRIQHLKRTSKVAKRETKPILEVITRERCIELQIALDLYREWRGFK